MGDGNDPRNLQALVDEHRIRQIPQDKLWPLALTPTFRAIRDLGGRTFEDYCHIIDTGAGVELWRQANKSRAEWLMKRAANLQGNATNENTWRHRVEPVLLEPFYVEVAW